MDDKEFELVKAVLINWLQQKLLRKTVIDKELFSLTHHDDSKLDFEIMCLEKTVSQKLRLIDRIKSYKERKQEKIELNNLKIRRGLILNLRNQRIEDLLKEKESLAYNEYNYISRIDYLSNVDSSDQIQLTEEEAELLTSIFPANYDWNKFCIRGMIKE